MDTQHIEKLIISLTQFARLHLSEARYDHSCRVAVFAQSLAQRYHCTTKQQRLCFLTGMAHDICKEMPPDVQLHLAQAGGIPLRSDEQNSTELLHGPAAAVVVREQFGIHKPAILRAIRYHTIGSAQFDAIGKIVYISDKIEPGRKNAELLRKKVPEISLDDLFFAVLDEAIHFVEKKGQSVHPATWKVYHTMQKQKMKEKKSE
ncbi:MAG: bis(5'-nucleosyl)-tetraphosphatase (symmetrical) YqeK [Treponema sp.]